MKTETCSVFEQFLEAGAAKENSIFIRFDRKLLSFAFFLFLLEKHSEISACSSQWLGKISMRHVNRSKEKPHTDVE